VITKPKVFDKIVKSSSEKTFDVDEFEYLENENRIVSISQNDKSLRINDLNRRTNWSIILDYLPSNLCVGANKSLFVSGTKENQKIYVYTKDFNLMKTFDIQMGYCLSKMKIDDSSQLLYLSHHRDNKITLWESQNGNYNKTIDIQSPFTIEFSKNLIYVISKTEFSCSHSKNSDDNLIKIDGLNCIFILNKATSEVMNKISFNRWLQPCGLYFDKKSEQLMTVSRELYEGQKKISKNRHLYIMSKTGQLNHKIELNFLGQIKSIDIKFNQNKIFRADIKSIQIIEFQ